MHPQRDSPLFEGAAEARLPLGRSVTAFCHDPPTNLRHSSEWQPAQAALGSIEPSVHENMKLIDHLWSQNPAADGAFAGRTDGERRQSANHWPAVTRPGRDASPHLRQASIRPPGISPARGRNCTVSREMHARPTIGPQQHWPNRPPYRLPDPRIMALDCRCPLQPREPRVAITDVGTLP